jgi:3-hydroxybutyryl-CoA dehydrogenase
MKTIGVIGTGTMGRGIAIASAVAGYRVVLNDINDAFLDEAKEYIIRAIQKGVELGKTPEVTAQNAIASLSMTTELSQVAKANLVIEAVPENLALKSKLFGQLDSICPEDTILATNTSSLSVTVLASATSRSERVVGLHFFNPAHIMRLVEIVTTEDTNPIVLSSASEFVERLGKTAVICKDTPAFIVNRVARPFYGEALRLLGEDAGTVAVIDRLLRSVGFRMGPFELIDLVGCDVNLAVTKSVYEANFQDPKYRPHPLQQRMVDSGRLGRKSGRGFYAY